MKYTKLFNNHNEYVAYTGGTSFIRPNVSYCIQEDEPHCTPAEFNCQDNHVYDVIGEPSYPETVSASATSFTLSFDYKDTHTLVSCEVVVTTDTDSVSISIEENPSTESRTISGSYNFHGIAIPYSLTQEGKKDSPYDQQYLTFSVLSDGTIKWKSIGSGQAKTISYSKNNGSTWTEITATSSGVDINVETGDKVLIKGTNSSYASDKSNYSGFDGGTALCNVEGNIMSLVYGDNFVGNTAMTGTYNFCSLFKNSSVISAENLILPSTALTEYCYRAMFSYATSLTKAPQLPAMTLAKGCYWYMFEKAAITTAPDLLAETLVAECYGHMFEYCSSLNYIKALATSGFNTSKCKEGWTTGVASSGTFVKASSVEVSTWTRGVSGIPTNWLVYDEEALLPPTISYDGFSTITLTCDTEDAAIHYRLNQSGEYAVYATPITISEDTFIETYSTKGSYSSITVSENCEYVSDVPIEYSNRDLKKWQHSGNTITTPYSVNGIDGQTGGYKKGTFNFETSFALREEEPTYLWFQHADQSATIYIDDTLVEKHWGGYAAFTTDISNYVHQGVNRVKVSLNNNEGNNLAPADADFNFNATLGNVRLLTSPYVPAMNYGYDGFHITSTVSDAEATINIKTSVPTGATLVCKIDDGNTNIYSATSASTGEEMTFTKVITNPHLWDGTLDPHMYTVTLEIYKGNDIYHRFVRPYGLRYYEYVINDTEKVGTVSEPYTGFLLNGHKYLLRGCCMHDDIAGKANALNETDYDNTFATIQELGLNFLRLAHYPHPKEVYDRCDALGIIVQTEAPCVNKLQSTMPTDYYTHLIGQYTDMVNQHYNHPCIVFWGLSNETTTDNKDFGKQKIEEYTALIKSIDSERWVGYVLAQSPSNGGPSQYYKNPNCDWFGSNIYVGWYDTPNSNTPVSQLNTRLNKTTVELGKPLAYSEYGCGGTQNCHTDDISTTNKGSGGARHDIEHMMWLHEGHVATIKDYPQLVSTSQWQLFDVAVSKRNEGYTVCLDGNNTSINDSLRHLNDKGLVERDHVTKKDPFYLYKAWWNQTDKFVHICQKSYQKLNDRVIKCYTNDGNTLTLYVNGVSAATATVTDNIALFTARNFNDGDTIMVSGATANDEFTIIDGTYKGFCKLKLNNGNEVEIEGSGELTSAMTAQYSATCTSVEIGTGCTSIGDDAFYNFKKLTNVAMYDNTISSIGDDAFYYCNGLTSVYIPSGVTSIGTSAFTNCDKLTSVAIPDSVTSIGESAFASCNALTSCTIGSGVTSIDKRTFYYCTSLKSIAIPNSVTSIGDDAFYICSGLTSVAIPDSVTSIGLGAFHYCRKLTSIVIPNSVTSIDDYAFGYCSSLTSITVDSSNTVYDSRNNCNAIIETSTNTLIQGCKNTVIPNSVTSIGDYAFGGCSGLTSVTIPNSVTSIGDDAFGSCDKLTSVTIPDSVISIGEAVFQGCSGLTSIDIPDSVTSIGSMAFQYCRSLTSVTIGNSVTSIGGNAFWMCYNITSIVSNAVIAPTITSYTFCEINKNGGTLTVPSGSSGYDVWMQNTNYYLGSSHWTKVEQ